MKISGKLSIRVLFVFCTLLVSGGYSFGSEYPTLEGLNSVQAVFDFQLGNPQMALVHLQVIEQTYQDENIQKLKMKPDVAVIFIGPSVKLVSKNKSGFTAGEQKILDEIASTISRMAKEGIRFEVCLVAAKIFGVDPSTMLPEIKKVGNGWISLIGHEAKGYALIPLFP